MKTSSDLDVTFGDLEEATGDTAAKELSRVLNLDPAIEKSMFCILCSEVGKCDAN